MNILDKSRFAIQGSFGSRTDSQLLDCAITLDLFIENGRPEYIPVLLCILDAMVEREKMRDSSLGYLYPINLLTGVASYTSKGTIGDDVASAILKYISDWSSCDRGAASLTQFAARIGGARTAALLASAGTPLEKKAVAVWRHHVMALSNIDFNTATDEIRNVSTMSHTDSLLRRAAEQLVKRGKGITSVKTTTRPARPRSLKTDVTIFFQNLTMR